MWKRSAQIVQFIFLYFISVCLFANEHWLEKLVMAAKETTYSGSFLYARGAEIQLMKITHRYNGQWVEERIWPINGRPMEIVRTNNTLICYHPEESDANLDHAIPAGPFAQIFHHQIDVMTKHYQVSNIGTDRIAERAVDILLIRPLEDDRYSFKLWLDQDNGLMLRSEIIGLDMQVLEQFQFVDIRFEQQLDDRLFEAKLALSGIGQSHKEVVPSSLTISSMPDSTIFPKYLPVGYELIGSTNLGRNQFQLAYSDGLSSFSLFVEPESMGMPDTSYIMGATQVLTRKVRNNSVTLIGELPLVSAEKIVLSVK